MVRYFSFVFIALFFLQSSYNTLVCIQFKMRQKYIASELCIQKGKRINTCNGKCYLKTHLQRDDSDFYFSYLKAKIELYCCENVFFNIPFIWYPKSMYPSCLLEFPIQNPHKIFHPPA